MATMSAIKTVLAYMDSAVESFTSQSNMIDKVSVITPNPGEFQNAGNFVVRPVQPHAADISGWDLTGLETGTIEEAYIAGMGTPSNAFVSLRVDDLRDIRRVKKQGKADGEKRASVLNKAIVDSIRLTGTMGYRTNVTSGFDAISLAQAGMNKRQVPTSDRYIALNDTHLQAYGKDLAGRQTLNGQPSETFQKGVLYPRVADFNVMSSSSISLLAGGADPATTVTGNQSFAPQGGSVTAAGNIVTNVDYRTATIPVAASASYNVGDLVTFANGGVTVKAVGRDDKTVTDEAMTFRIVSKPSGASIEVWPKPIANDDPALSTLEKTYSNINTRILNAATVNRLNIDASTQPSIFWQKDSIEVIAGEVPIEKLGEWGGMKVAKESLGNDLTMYMLYDANIATLQARWRCFVWYGVNNARPGDNGLLIKY